MQTLGLINGMLIKLFMKVLFGEGDTKVKIQNKCCQSIYNVFKTNDFGVLYTI